MGAERTCFDRVADLYQRVRPPYPAEVVDLLCERAGLPEGGGGAILEIGPGTGQLSVALCDRGHRLHAVELGQELSAKTREALAPYPEASVERADFELWQATESAAHQRFPEGYDLVVCAQAFHWLDPDKALPRAAAALRAEGRLALLWTLDRSQDSAVWKATNPVYARYGVGGGDPTLPARAAARERAVVDSEAFGQVESHSHTWERSLPRADWLALVQTFSSTLALTQEDQEDFLHDLEIVLKDFPTVTRSYESVLHLAKKA